MPQVLKPQPFAAHRVLVICFIVLALQARPAISAENETDALRHLLKLFEKAPAAEEPAEEMYSKNELIMCTGESKAAKLNNQAVARISGGDFDSALKLLQQGLKKAPLFFPFLYNAGICHIHLDSLKLAMLNFEKAAGVFPEYYKTYLQIGYILERQQKEDEAVVYYRKALEKNSRANEVFILIGNIHLKRGQLETANNYYSASLKISPKNPDALLGQAKIHYYKKEYYRATIILKYIPLKDEYDKSYHYYYAECAYKLRDYRTAHEQYQRLLEFKNDRFFLTNSVSLINHKLDLCARFLEIE